MIDKRIHCSFCHKSNLEVVQLITNGDVAICNECILECGMLLVDDDKRATANFPCGSLGEQV